MRILTLTGAFRRAANDDVECRVMVGVADCSRAVRVSVATSDEDPMLTLAVGDAREVLLRTREQSAPDRWDYFTTSAELAGRQFLRLSRGDAHADIEILGAARTIIATYGWTDDASLVAEAVVDATAFDSALAHILEGTA